MDIANVMVALGGDTGNTVPKYGVTAAEVAVLMTIHGASGGDTPVFDIEPAGTIARSNREERQRLVETYRAKNNEGKQIVAEMFPGVGARVPETLAELDLDESFYKATTRLSAPVVEEAPAAEAAPAAKAKRGKKAAAEPTTEPVDADAIEAAVANDGIGDL